MRSENATKTRRSYGDACAAAHALDLVGERWALLVMRELLLGPKRFSDLRADLPGISANVLTQRLQDLELAGVLVRRKLAPPASGQVYELTPWGYESEPIFHVLGRWAVRSPSHDPRLPISAVSLLISFRAAFDPELVKGMEARVGLSLGREDYLLHIGGGTLQAARGSVEGADLVFEGPPSAVAAAIYGGVPIDALETAGTIAIKGDRALAARFVRLFPLPTKVSAEAA